MKKTLALVISTLAVGALSASMPALAESVAMPVPAGQQGNLNVETPRRGLYKQNVEQQFGAPNQKIAAVGEPPISRWVYTDFTVYFDTDYVVHSVRHPSK